MVQTELITFDRSKFLHRTKLYSIVFSGPITDNPGRWECWNFQHQDLWLGCLPVWPYFPTFTYSIKDGRYDLVLNTCNWNCGKINIQPWQFQLQTTLRVFTKTYASWSYWRRTETFSRTTLPTQLWSKKELKKLAQYKPQKWSQLKGY